MKKNILLLSAAILGIASFAFAATEMKPEAKPELRPLQIIMQARAGWMKSMNENLSAKKFADVSKDAAALSAQAKKVGEAAPNPLAKEFHLAVSSLAKATSEAADKADEPGVKAKLGEIKAKCAECHAKIRDKK
jgi:cytochrome c556